MRIVNFSGETILKYYDANKKKRGNLFVLILEQSLKGGVYAPQEKVWTYGELSETTNLTEPSHYIFIRDH